VKVLIAGLSILALAACARPAAKPTSPVRVVVREAKDVQDFWRATLTRPLRMKVARGSIRASAVYPNPLPYHSRVRVTDGARTLVDTVVADVPMGWQFVELEGHRRVLLFDGFTGGAHCCFDTTIVQLGSAKGGTTRVDWGNLGRSLMRSALGTGDVFRTGDNDMAYAFSSFAASTFAIKILAYRNGAMRDVTGEYPALIEHDAREQWSILVKRMRSSDPFMRAALEPPIVSYLADEYRLGRGAQGLTRVRAANGPSPVSYATALTWLREHGYAS